MRGCRGRAGASGRVPASACIAPPGPRGTVHRHAHGHSTQDLVFASKYSRLPSRKSPQTFRDSSGTKLLPHGKKTESPRGVFGRLCHRRQGANRIFSRRSRTSKCSEGAKGNRQGGHLRWALGAAPSMPCGPPSVWLPATALTGHSPNWNAQTWGGGRLKLQALSPPKNQSHSRSLK